jgi:hypothetical protein
LDLSLESVDLVLDNDLLLSKRTAEGDTPSVEVQRKWYGVTHRLKLLGSQPVSLAVVPKDYNVSILQRSQLEWLFFFARHFCDDLLP